MQSQCPKGRKEAVCGSPAGRRCHLPAGSRCRRAGHPTEGSTERTQSAQTRAKLPDLRAEEEFWKPVSKSAQQSPEAHVCQLREAQLHPAGRALPAPRQVQPAFGVTAGRVTSASLTLGFLLHVGLAPFFQLQREMFRDDRETRTFLQQEFFIHTHANSAACPS